MCIKFTCQAPVSSTPFVQVITDVDFVLSPRDIIILKFIAPDASEKELLASTFADILMSYHSCLPKVKGHHYNVVHGHDTFSVSNQMTVGPHGRQRRLALMGPRRKLLMYVRPVMEISFQLCATKSDSGISCTLCGMHQLIFRSSQHICHCRSDSAKFRGHGQQQQPDLGTDGQPLLQFRPAIRRLG